MSLHRRLRSPEFSEEDEHLSAGEGDRGGFEVLEFAFGLVAGGLGQGQPQLDTVQGRGLLGRDLGVADASACGHEVDLAGQDEAGVAAGVDVLNGAFEQPAHGLQSGVRVRGDVHAAGDRDIGWPVVVDEAPGADEGALPLRQGAAHDHRPRPAERNLTGGDDFNRGTSLLVTGRPGQSPGLADHLIGAGLDVAHGHIVALFAAGGEGDSSAGMPLARSPTRPGGPSIRVRRSRPPRHP